MIKLGMNGKLYRNSGTWAAPAWVEVPGVKDVSIAIATGSGDASTRAMLPWKIDVVTLLEASVELDMPYDPTDAQYQAFRTAFLARTAIECAVMHGPIATPGSEGLHAAFAVTKFDRSESLTEPMVVKMSLKPTWAANVPEWLVVGGAGLTITFTATLAAGVGAIDLTAIPYGAGTYDATGEKVVSLQIANAGANILTVSKAVANGYDLFANTDPIVVPAAGNVQLAGDGGGAIGSGAKALTLAGTGTQSSTWTITLE